MNAIALLALSVPDFDPIALQIGPLAIRWYSLAYIVGLLVGWRYCLRLADKLPGPQTRLDIDDLFVWVTFGVILGGRIGYVAFYQPGLILGDPLQIFKVWEGGMSFHGGLLGVIVGGWLFCRRRKIAFWPIFDIVCAAAPIGLFLGRVANFVNGELYGRVTDVAWAVVFRTGGPLPRHPSQLYEAGLEGLVLFVVLLLVARGRWGQRTGTITGVFFTGYALSRLTVELVRQPDAHIGFLAGGLTMGQYLSLPMLAFGLYMILRPPAGAGSDPAPANKAR